MDRKIWLSLVAAVIGAGLLVAAATLPDGEEQAPKANARPQKGGTIVVELDTDVDYIDPALAYFTGSWN